MLDSNQIIILIIILFVIYFLGGKENFECVSHGANYDACYKDPESCTIQLSLNGIPFCTKR
jgi:hypothetical protein